MNMLLLASVKQFFCATASQTRKAENNPFEIYVEGIKIASGYLNRRVQNSSR